MLYLYDADVERHQCEFVRGDEVNRDVRVPLIDTNESAAEETRPVCVVRILIDIISVRSV